MFDNLQDNETLQHLSVSFNFDVELDEDTVGKIMESLQYNDVLKYFELKGESIGDIDLQALIQQNRSSGQLAPKGKARKRHDTYHWLMSNTGVTW